MARSGRGDRGYSAAGEAKNLEKACLEADPERIYLPMLEGLPYMMNTRQVAEALNVTAQEIRKLLNGGELRGTRVGTTWIVPKPQLLRYLYENHNYPRD
ncbi:helix-turn-helix domain-containing protein [Raoultibacter phocaeensis]|uniref:helix-turn-helix domain-containing protein n=1 Tax=Raoultibacter phocaeensis TaxID=2479841 RepID=UPI001119D648|nr:helix-turn-helix domain-containing protein [Raoultibacter phocaeensis]